ncbi:hypothetical protein STEG23_017740, partial [Scotinomys teguina]
MKRRCRSYRLQNLEENREQVSKKEKAKAAEQKGQSPGYIHSVLRKGFRESILAPPTVLIRVCTVKVTHNGLSECPDCSSPASIKFQDALVSVSLTLEL